MSITDIGKVCLFSSMSGIVTLNGEPAVNARLVRTATLSKAITDETVTDEHGYFVFPAVFQRTITKFLPMEFVAQQKIIAHYKGQTYVMWDGIKRKREENVEGRGEPPLVECDLGMKEIGYKSVNGGPIFSRCAWMAEPDSPYEGPVFDES